MEIKKKKKGLTANIAPMESLKAKEPKASPSISAKSSDSDGKGMLTTKDISSMPQISAKTGGSNLSVKAVLEGAKKAKPKKLEGEISLGPTSMQENVRADRLEYYKRLKKRAK